MERLNAKARAVLDFWFDGITDRSLVTQDAECVKRWFARAKATDKMIKKNFSFDLMHAKTGEYDFWAESPRGMLALIILLDQFSRHIFRDTARAFEADALARRICLDGIRRGFDQKLELIERTFFALPLMHAEDRALHVKMLAYYRKLAESSRKKCPHNTGYFRESFQYAQRHAEIIRRFGRYPHRNEILGRKSTAREKAFLKKPGSSF